MRIIGLFLCGDSPPLRRCNLADDVSRRPLGPIKEMKLRWERWNKYKNDNFKTASVAHECMRSWTAYYLIVMQAPWVWHQATHSRFWFSFKCLNLSLRYILYNYTDETEWRGRFPIISDVKCFIFEVSLWARNRIMRFSSFKKDIDPFIFRGCCCC